MHFEASFGDLHIHMLQLLSLPPCLAAAQRGLSVVGVELAAGARGCSLTLMAKEIDGTASTFFLSSGAMLVIGRFNSELKVNEGKYDSGFDLALSFASFSSTSVGGGVFSVGGAVLVGDGRDCG